MTTQTVRPNGTYSGSGDFTLTGGAGSIHATRSFVVNMGTYTLRAGAFIPPQPFPSWTLDANHDWQPPIPMPLDGKGYAWDEDTLSWVEVTA